MEVNKTTEKIIWAKIFLCISSIYYAQKDSTMFRNTNEDFSQKKCVKLREQQ